MVGRKIQYDLAFDIIPALLIEAGYSTMAIRIC
jgi:hypothetical protein